MALRYKFPTPAALVAVLAGILLATYLLTGILVATYLLAKLVGLF
jgi:hypothetical protein